MNPDEQEFAKLLRAAMPPVGNREPSADLWPRLAARMAEPLASRWTAWDWALAAAAVVCGVSLPGGLSFLGYAL